MAAYEPCSNEHAIDLAVIGVRIRGDVADAEFGAAAELAKQLAVDHNLPGFQMVDPMALLIGRENLTTGYAGPTEMKPGFVFHRFQPDGTVAEEFTLERNAVTYRTRSYRRWTDMQELIRGVIIPISSELSKQDSSRLSVIELRCLDRFISKHREIELSTLIREGCEFVPNFHLSRNNFMHNHTGWFQDHTESGRTLVTINLDIAEDAESNLQATILQVAAYQTSGIGQYFESNLEYSDLITQQFEKLHKINKNTLSRILTDQMQSRISLLGTSGIQL